MTGQTKTSADRAQRLLSRIIEPTVLREHGLTIGMIDIDGAGRRVCVWNGYESRHMSAAAAKRLAAEYITSEQSVPLKPVHDALMKAAESIEAHA